ncbi:MAG: nucleoside deaminase, partial [Candidatus Omnitrophica bacterium]|nr:nucleoside deaminase [Candidatus Omnitrophota bacterium]
VIVHENKIIARAHNQVEMLKDPTAHAEMIAITQATNFLGIKWLNECVLYVTLEPCSMCAGALVLARMKKVIYGAKDPKAGGCGSVTNVIANSELNHRCDVQEGLMAEACGYLLSDFFQNKRKQNKNNN